MEQNLVDPFGHSGPVASSYENNRETAGLARLDEGHRIEKLVQRAESAGEADKSTGVFHKHHQPDEEVSEIQRYVLERVGELLYRKGNVQADRRTAGFDSAMIGRGHYAGPAACDNGVLLFGEHSPQLAGFSIIGIVLGGPGRSEDAHGGAYAAHCVETIDKFAQYSKDSPGIFTDKLRLRFYGHVYSI